jgi:hypothetical protein
MYSRTGLPRSQCPAARAITGNPTSGCLTMRCSLADGEHGARHAMASDPAPGRPLVGLSRSRMLNRADAKAPGRAGSRAEQPFRNTPTRAHERQEIHVERRLRYVLLRLPRG